MHNNNRILEEISRMIELSESNEKKSGLIKESIKTKINPKPIIKEEDEGDEWGAAFDFDDEDGEGLGQKDDQGLTLSPTEDIPLLLKLALVTHSINSFQSALFGLSQKDFVKVYDLSSGDGDNFENLYPMSSREEFEDLTKKGRLVVDFQGKKEDVDEKELGKVYRWLGGVKNAKTLHNIGFDTEGSLSSKGNAELNFLARILSNKPKGADEEKILENLGASAKQNAAKILLSFYDVAAKNTLLPLLNMQPTPENLTIIKDGVVKAIADLAGITGVGMEKGKTNWDGKQNVGPWFLQVVKHHAKDALKGVSDYTPDISSAEGFFQNMLNREGVIRVVSSKEPSHEHFADDVVESGNKYVYTYSDVNDALSDLQSSINVPNHHMKFFNLPKEYKPLFASQRKAPTSMSGEMERDMEPRIGREEKQIEPQYEEAIKDILGNAVEFGSLDVVKYGLSSKHSEHMKASQEKSKDREKLAKTKKLAKGNIVNFMYNFLLGMVGDSTIDGEKVRDLEKSGKIAKEMLVGTPNIPDASEEELQAMSGWIDNQNLTMLKRLKEVNPEKDTKEIASIAKKNGLLIGTKEIQGIWNALKDYLQSNPEEFQKLLSYVGYTSPEGYEQDIDLALEHKIRVKIQRILKESFVVSEVEDDFISNVEDINVQIEKFGNNAKKLLKTDKYSTEELNNEILNAIETGRGKWNYENSAANGVYNYITTVIASVYNLLSTAQQDKAVEYLFVSLFPRATQSSSLRGVAKKYERMGGAPLNLSDEKDADLAWSSVMEIDSKGNMPIVSALENFDPTKDANFIGYLFSILAYNLSNLVRTQSSYQKQGERFYVTPQSLDAPLKGSGGEEDESNTLLSKLDSTSAEDLSDEKNFKKNAAKELLSFMRQNLSKSEYDLFVTLNTSNRYIKDNGNVDHNTIANDLEISPSNSRSILNRINNKFKNLIKDGELRSHMIDKAGIDINKTPKIKDFLEFGEYKIGDYGSKAS
jgi:hypothetical protein